MNYPETLAFLFSRLPYFTRDGKAALKPNLDNTLALCKVLGNPHQKLKTIHIAGTNGKGSVSNMLAAVLQQHGFKTGLYTSPHLKDFRERIRINGIMIPESDVIKFVSNHMNSILTINPSFFEVTVAMAFDYFEKEKVDFAIIEVGLGGRLDSTNVITPLLSVITNIGLDHTDLLGDTLDAIAREKAGIIKPNIPVLIGEMIAQTESVFKQKSLQQNAPLYIATEVIKKLPTWDFDLKGPYQIENITTTLAAVEILKQNNIFKPTKAKLQYAFENTCSITGFKGRWEILRHSNPKIIADTGHNEHGLKITVGQLQKESYNTLRIVFGMMSDKTKILNLMPQNAVYYFCNPDLPRAKKAEDLQIEAAEYGLVGKAYTNVSEALKQAKSDATPDDLIFIGGSTFVVAEVL